MHVTVGDVIVLETERVARPVRTGVIDQVLRRDPPRYRVNWDDGRTTILAPASGVASIELGPSRSLASSSLGRSPSERVRRLEERGRRQPEGRRRTAKPVKEETMSQMLPDRRGRAGSGQWEPVLEMEQVADRLRRMLDQTFGLSAPALLSESASWTPLVDIEEQDDAYVLEAELPGVKREDVNIEVVGNELTISGEVKEREREGIVRRRTRRVGRFDYRVRLPEQVDPEKIEAALSDGVLRVRVPKSERAQRRRVEVKSS